MNRYIRVLHLPVNNGSRTSHTVRALRQIGVDAFGLVRTRALVQSPAGLRIINLGSRRPSGQLLRSILPWVHNFLKYVRWADVIHWYSGAMALPFGLDLALVRRLHKPGIVEWQGSEIRIPEVEFAENPYYRQAYPNGYEYRKTESLDQSRCLQKRFHDAGFATVSPLGMLQYVQRDLFPDVYVVPVRLIMSDYEPAFPSPFRQRAVVIHSPTAPITKGTAAVLSAVQQLENRLDFEFRLVQGLSRDEAIRLTREADVFLDQFVLGDFGSAALEAMAFGKPVICYIKPSLATLYSPELPILSATQEELASVLERVLTDPGLRHDLGRRSRAYVEKHHNALNVAHRLKEIYEEVA